MRRTTVTAVSSLLALSAAALFAPAAFGDPPIIPGMPPIPTGLPTGLPGVPNLPGAPVVPGANDALNNFVLPPCPPSLADLPVGVATVTGTVQTPSGAYALAGAKVTLVNSAGAEVGSTLSDGCGRFRLDSVVAGKYTVKFGVRTFKGSAAVDVPITGTKVTLKADVSFIKIAVFEGEWDHIEKILAKIGVPFTKFPARSVGQQDLSKFNVVFINCGETNDSTVTANDKKKLTDFVDGGGALYVSDRAVPYLTQTFPGAINAGENSGPAGMRKGNVIDVQLGSFLRGSVAIPLNYNLGGWRRLSKNQPATTFTLLRDSESQEPSIVTFFHGSGFVGYTTFHDEAQMNDGMTYSLIFFITRM